MWFLIVALISVVSSLFVGRLLARAVAEQTNPRPVRGPALANHQTADRLTVAAHAVRARHLSEAVHLN